MKAELTAPVDNDADVLALLNGGAPEGMPPYAPGSIPGAPPIPRDTELTVRTAPAALSPLKAADAQHSLAVGGVGYRVDVRGEYFANNPDGKGKIKRPYELSFNVAKAEGAPSVIKNKLLLAALKKKHPDAVRHRTFYVIKMAPRSASTPKSNNLAYMDRGQLEQYVSFAGVPVAIGSYAKTDEGTTHLREAVIDFVQNPDPVRLDDKGRNTVIAGDPGTFLAREKERQEKREGDAELRALNPDLDLP